MSSDSDELGGFNPTTPVAPSKKRKAPPSRVAAGPSTTKAPKSAAGRPRKPSRESPMVIDDEDEDVPEVIESEPRTKGKEKAAASPVVNGKPASKVKAKTKANATANVSRKDSTPVIVEDLDDEEPPPARPPPVTKKTNGRAGTDANGEKERRPLARELEKMKEERDMYKEQNEQLTKQMRELLQVRNTDPEGQLEAMKAQYEASTKAQEELIKELTAQIARLNPMLREGRTSTLHFLTREAADEEKRSLEDRLEQVRETLKQKDTVIKDKDSRIATLEEQLETTQTDLKAEIAHSQTLQTKNTRAARDPPGSTLRGRDAADPLIGDPKHGITIRLYEDLTNLIVLNAKIHPGPFAHLNLEDTTYTCVWSHGAFSLSFTLTSTHQNKNVNNPVKTKGDLTQMVRYAPLELDKESAEHVAKLDFLADTFTFEYEQMGFFLKTLNEHVAGLQDDQDDSAMTEG
ncbi:hypothetical protein BC834DRAFT_965951 [Gloeopeniophorella convolvens]|nr:hypothetical protein BC834DRAFT_965951 [Gloeopeniophorella convolvens]